MPGGNAVKRIMDSISDTTYPSQSVESGIWYNQSKRGSPQLIVLSQSTHSHLDRIYDQQRLSVAIRLPTLSQAVSINAPSNFRPQITNNVYVCERSSRDFATFVHRSPSDAVLVMTA